MSAPLDLDRVVLLVGEPLDKLKAKSPWAWRYIRYGMTATFASSKSKGKPVPTRSTCAARDPWYDLTGLVRPGFGFWPKIQQYRHIVPANGDGTICNCNLYDLHSQVLDATQQRALLGILNSTLVGFFKAFLRALCWHRNHAEDGDRGRYIDGSPRPATGFGGDAFAAGEVF